MNFTRCPEGDLHGFRTTDQPYYYLTDILGSVEAVVDADGNKINQYLYELFGVLRPETSEQVPQPHRWAGGYQDPTHQYHFGARYLEPSIGRFTQPDPSGQELNAYLYATGDPANRIAPSGLFWGEGILKAAVSALSNCSAGIFAAGNTGVLECAGLLGGPWGYGFVSAASCGAGMWAGSHGVPTSM
ncbi:RHS repeat domain-containing protein [Streptomyces sp. NPDC102381]|uniref:RHS repeat domain-containing protein n=1 Tax=Streptomyces sp. NPDC102381 TaxID=3366164 RepID=UPI0037FA9235